MTDGRPQVARARWWIHLVLIGGYFLPSIPLGLWRMRGSTPDAGTSGRLVMTCSVELALFSLVFLLGWTASRASSEELLWKWRPAWGVVPLGVAYSILIRIGVAFATMFVASALLVLRLATTDSLKQFFMSEHPHVERVLNTSAIQNDTVYFWLTITLLSFVVAGLREEMWRAGTLAAMRNLWPRFFTGREGEIAAVILIAIVFGLGHLGFGLLAAAIAALLGLMLGIIMVVHRSIWPAVIAHGCWDAASFATMHWLGGGLPQLR